ncbi:Nitroreductase family [Phytophthora palmivora]|uniref:Nitroreductase family n=1 Tax=Phytophthora palmivora TaxID=4796 RepID=A0A2P4YJH6_9STRA|nr:Nitroreductase family [Phytophthora palmivora]
MSLRWTGLLRQGTVAHTRRLSNSAQKSLGAAIEERYACKAFLPDPVPDETLKEILQLTLRAPTGFNTMPYACVLVREQKDREKLAEAMMDSNARKVKEAPVVVVFAADLEPSKRVPRLQKLAHDNGAPADFVSNMPHVVRLFSGEGAVASGLRAALATVVSPLLPSPSNVSTEAWSFKQTTFAAATFLYAAQVHGLATCPMEGFDQVRVRNALDIPDRYGVPVVIALGHANPAAKPEKPSVRLDPTEVFFDGKFGDSSDKIFANK